MPLAWVVDLILVLLLVAFSVLLHLWVPGEVPSGGDGGNWLALSDELRGVGAMSAEVTYPVLFPALVAGGKLLFGDAVFALTSAAVVAKVVFVVAVYVCTRTLGPVLALIAALVAGTTGALLEAYAWGAYPQILAQGLALLGTFFIVRYLDTYVKGHLVLGLGFAALTLMTHLMIGALLGIVILLATSHFLYMVDPRPAPRLRAIKTGVGVAIPVLLLGGLSMAIHVSGGLGPTVNPVSLGRWEAMISVVRDAPVPWVVFLMAGIAVLFFRYWPDHVASTIAVGSSWLISGLALFLVLGEPRTLLMVQTGVVILAVVGFGAAHEYLRPTGGAREARRGARRVWRPLLVIGAFSIAVSIMAGGASLYVAATDWYRVVDHDEIAALDQLATNSEDGDLTFAAAGRHGNPVGWWVEGYAQRPTYTAVDPAFLAFPDEREQAEIAASFFSGDLNEDESLALLEETGARYIVVDKRGPDAFWLGTEFAQALPVLDDSSNIVILEVPPGELN